MSHSKPKAKEVFSVSYYSERGRCYVLQVAEPGRRGSRPFCVYIQDEGQNSRYYECHSTQANAEASARWMAMGL